MAYALNFFNNFSPCVILYCHMHNLKEPFRKCEQCNDQTAFLVVCHGSVNLLQSFVPLRLLALHMSQFMQCSIFLSLFHTYPVKLQTMKYLYIGEFCLQRSPSLGLHHTVQCISMGERRVHICPSLVHSGTCQVFNYSFKADIEIML